MNNGFTYLFFKVKYNNATSAFVCTFILFMNI